MFSCIKVLGMRSDSGKHRTMSANTVRGHLQSETRTTMQSVQTARPRAMCFPPPLCETVRRYCGNDLSLCVPRALAVRGAWLGPLSIILEQLKGGRG